MAKKIEKDEPAFIEEKAPTPEISNPDGLPFPAIMEEGRPNLTYDMIKANLLVPINPVLISQKPVGRGNDEHFVDYVNITDMKDILDDRAGLWTALVKKTIVAEGMLLMVVSITIHAEDGDFTQDGTGFESLNFRGFGDIYSSAYAQAFRRAAEGHGLGRELWRKVEKKAAQYTERQVNDSPAPRPQNNQAPPRQPMPQYSGGGNNQAPSNGQKRAEPMTLRQRGFIENICVQEGKNMDMIALEMFKKNFDDLLKPEASKMIEQLAPKG
jgi:hypothetical protein